MIPVKVSCPVCGSTALKKSEEQKQYAIGFGQSFTYPAINFICETCGEEGDFALQNDAVFEAALKKAQSEQIKDLIERLGQRQISMSLFERALELPARTLTRWKSGDFSSSSIALLRAVAAFPFILKAAEVRFNEPQCKALVVREAAETLGTLIHQMGGGTLPLVELVQESPSTVTFKAVMRLPEPEEPELPAITAGTNALVAVGG